LYICPGIFAGSKNHNGANAKPHCFNESNHFAEGFADACIKSYYNKQVASAETYADAKTYGDAVSQSDFRSAFE